MTVSLTEEREASRLRQEGEFVRAPTPVLDRSAAGLFVGPLPEGSIGSLNPPEHFRISSPGLRPGPPPQGPPSPPRGDSNDKDDEHEDDERRRRQDKKKSKKKKKRDSSSDSSSSTDIATKIAKALEKMAKSKKNEKDESDDDAADKDEKPKKKPKEAGKMVFPIFALPEQYRSWKIRVREAVGAASAQPDLAFVWLSAVWDKDTTEEGLRDPKGFATWDA